VTSGVPPDGRLEIIEVRAGAPNRFDREKDPALTEQE
jgi:hypothetical protein